MQRYCFEDGFHPVKNVEGADPQVIGEALDEIAGASGRLRPVDVVEAARSPAHALHPFFEWDDVAAAEAYRVEQARSLIRVVRVADISTNEPPRAFISVADTDGRSYRRYSEVRASSVLQLAVMEQAERDLIAFERRYRNLTDVCDLVKVARSKVAERKAAMENAKAPVS